MAILSDLLKAILLASGLWSAPACKDFPEHSFVIVICSYNNKDWFQKNLESALNQDYGNFRIIYIDDCSPDMTGHYVEQYLKQYDRQNRCTLIRNEVRRHKLANLFDAIHQHCADNEIIVELDGDDWLLSNNVLTYLNELYHNHDIWITYGGLIMEPVHFARLKTQNIPPEVIANNSVRSFFKKGYPFLALRTFYAGLFKKVLKDDLMINGTFFSASSDIATMIPMLEMAGQRVLHLEKPVYVYNTNTGNNDYHTQHTAQLHIADMIEKKQPYYALPSL